MNMITILSNLCYHWQQTVPVYQKSMDNILDLFFIGSNPGTA